ncbi:hypothetical protein [Propionivibrio soli]|uniref:hypothetical protein n=1 Tax=Propionivibrio soli TaxID=2976531 RepID=UPI0021E7B4BF|nr:hypothetical protein [Propionivibrio soli]
MNGSTIALLISAVLIGACSEPKDLRLQPESAQQQQDKDLQTVLIKPYDREIPLIGDEKMKTKNWSSNASAKSK